MEKVTKLVLLLMWGGLASLAYGQATPLDVIVWSEGFQGFDPCTANPPFSGDLPGQDASWRNDGADATIVADERLIEDFINAYSPTDPCFVPDPCNYVLAVPKTDTVGMYAMGYAVKDFASIAASVGYFGDHLRLDFDTFRTHQPDSWWTDVMRVRLRTATQTDIVDLNMINVPYEYRRQLNGVDIPGAVWSAPEWNHYGIFINFASDLVSLYVGDEFIPRLTVPLATDYSAADITAIDFGSGLYYKANRSHSQFFDNILLTANWICPAGDLDGDCAVGMTDLAVMASTWLEGPTAVP